MAYSALGRKADSDASLAHLEKAHADQNPFRIAQVNAFRGESDEALKWLERAFAQKSPQLLFIKVDTLFRKLEGDPRYKALLKKMNLPEG